MSGVSGATPTAQFFSWRQEIEAYFGSTSDLSGQALSGVSIRLSRDDEHASHVHSSAGKLTLPFGTSATAGFKGRNGVVDCGGNRDRLIRWLGYKVGRNYHDLWQSLKVCDLPIFYKIMTYLDNRWVQCSHLVYDVLDTYLVLSVILTCVWSTLWLILM